MITYFNNYSIKVNNSETIDLADFVKQVDDWIIFNKYKNFEEYSGVFQHRNGKHYRIIYKFSTKLINQIINNGDTYIWVNVIKYLPFDDYSYIDRIIKLDGWTDLSDLVSHT